MRGRAPPRHYLVLSDVALGQVDVAAWDVEQLHVNDPGFSLSTVELTLPVTDPEQLGRMKNNLYRTGLFCLPGLHDIFYSYIERPVALSCRDITVICSG